MTFHLNTGLLQGCFQPVHGGQAFLRQPDTAVVVQDKADTEAQIQPPVQTHGLDPHKGQGLPLTPAMPFQPVCVDPHS